MNGSTTLWIVLGILALLVIAAVIYFVTRKQTDTRRSKAKSLRQDADSHTESLRKREAKAAESHSRADKAQAEADQKAAEARRLRERAQHDETTVAESREEVQARLRRADKVDPDTDNRRK